MRSVCPVKFARKQKVMGPKFEGMEMKITGEEAEKKLRRSLLTANSGCSGHIFGVLNGSILGALKHAQ